MFGLYMLAIYLGVAVIVAGFVRAFAERILERPTRAGRRARVRFAPVEFVF